MQRSIVITQKIFVPYRVNGQGFKKPFTFSANEKEATRFRDSVPVCNMHGCYQIMQKFRATFHSYPSDTRRLECVDVNNPLQKVFKRVYTIYTNSNVIFLTNNLTNIWSEISKF